jgi:hypothetical protein
MEGLEDICRLEPDQGAPLAPHKGLGTDQSTVGCTGGPNFVDNMPAVDKFL